MKKKLLALFSIFAMSMAFTLTSCVITSQNSTVQGAVEKYEVTVQTSTETPNYGSLVEMIEAVRPSVVEIYTQSEIAQGTGAGSGVILSATGLETTNTNVDDYYFVLTCHHVIEGCDKYLVEDIYGVQYTARLIGGDRDSDIAVLKLHPYSDGYAPNKVKLGVATIRDINGIAPLKIGEDVVAIGNPLGILGGSVTKGIISSIERTINVADIGSMKLIQTDCATNGGSSGGGLFDAQGNLVGITNSGFEAYEGLNFAIPIDDAMDIYESLTETYFYNSETVYNYGYVKGKARACAEYNYVLSFGSQIAIADYSHNFRSYLVCIMEIKAGSVYDEAGLMVGDLIRAISYNGETYSVNLNSSARSSDTVAFLNKLKLSVGDTVTFKVERAGATKTFTVTYKQFIYGDTGYTLVEE